MREKGKLTKPLISAVQCMHRNIYASMEPQCYWCVFTVTAANQLEDLDLLWSEHLT